jgi:hypothetical protein
MKTAAEAVIQGSDCFSTSLLISPYQNHELLKEIGYEIGEKIGIAFYYEDFKQLYRTGLQLARGYGWYIQKYCGCAISYNESDHPKKPDYR